MAEDKDTVDVHIHFNKSDAKTVTVFVIGLIVIFCLAESTALKIGCALVAVLFVIGKCCSGSSTPTEDVKNETVKPESVKQAESEDKPKPKEIRKPKMPEETKVPAEEQSVTPEIKTEETDMNNDDWEDFFASLDNNK